ncbi:MAG: response regulator [Gemmatimonadota bacterium]
MTPSAGNRVRVLFVEDAFDQALLVKGFLQEAGGYDVTHSQDGDHAVQLLRDREWDVLITDLNLPGTDGFEVIRVAREAHPDLPIVAVTGYTGAAYHEQALRAGADDVLTKPLDRDEFLAKVVELTKAAQERSRERAIIAVGGLVGDVEMGCGGTLLTAAAAGTDILVVPLCNDEMDPEGAGIRAARKAADLLGVRVLLDEAAMRDPAARVSLLELAVRELNPSVAYVPAMDDVHPSRMDAFRIAKAATESVPLVLGYQTATTGMDFRPTYFSDIGERMIMKMEVLGTYQAEGCGRLDLTPRMAQAYARYWGRFRRFTEVEPFEVVRGNP